MDLVGSDINRCSGTAPVVDGFNIMLDEISITCATAVSGLKRAFSGKAREIDACSSHYPREAHARAGIRPNYVLRRDNAAGQSVSRRLAFAPGSKRG